ncbi:cytochrome P450 [Hymenopellis radicata]|nr:cytochrome P450 [Hymenopellis radicata]
MSSFALQQLSYLSLFFLLVVARFLYLLFYRLYLHPLKAFPGPRLAAVTDYYQGYFEVWKNGMFVEHLEKLHEIYGTDFRPVVRVRPNELHFNTAEAYFAIYLPTAGFRKDPDFYTCFGEDDAAFGMTNVQDHKIRREILNPLFSRRAILNLESFVQEKVDLFAEEIRKYKTAPVSLFHGFRSLAMDIVTAYSYAHSFGGLTTPGFNHPILRAVEGAIPLMTATKFFPILHALHHIPDWLGVALNPEMGGVAQLRAFLAAQVDAILRDPDHLQSVEHETIYHHLITPDLVKKGEVPSKKALIEEAMVLLIAGTDTSSNAMSMGFFHLMANESIKKKLQAELREAWPEMDTPFSYEMAERLPYLTGVIKESLRFSTGIPVSLPRVVESTTVIDGHVVPAGCIIGVAQPFVLKNPEVFPDPLEFRPERWIGNEQKLDKYLVVFSKGPRSCLGMTLGWCELYLSFAHLMRKFDFQLFETGPEDMVFRAHAVPVWKTRPLHAIVTEQVD